MDASVVVVKDHQLCVHDTFFLFSFYFPEHQEEGMDIFWPLQKYTGDMG